MRKKYSVLMVLMRMEIGGAETHVLELSKALKRLGLEVYVVSNGGVYAEQLSDSGILHFNLPLHNKQPQNMLRSYLGLERIIREYSIDIVHAHARIPAFICGLLYKKMKFHFVTSAHGVYNPEFPLNILTNWGQRTIAVSDDIKEYLMCVYKLREEDIVITINGIDTDKFSPNTDFSDIIKEFNLDIENKRIVYVSRLDKASSLAAHKILDCAENIYAKHQDIDIIIVGHGTDYENVRKKAEKVNSAIGRRVVLLTGARVDINKFMASATFFVGVSRSALEAMSAQKPVVLAGAQGYIGVFTPDRTELAISTNFCCRDCETATASKIEADCLALLEAEQQELTALGVFGQEIVVKNYSVDKMLEDNISVYEYVFKIHLRKIDAVISGYYGSRNSGDDALLKSIVDSLKQDKPEMNIVVLSRRPTETRQNFGVSSIFWLDIFSIINTMKNAKILISGGGNLMQDGTSTRTLTYYLFIIRLAKRYGAKAILYANGIGPIKREKNIKSVKKYLNRIDYITLREEKSLEELRNIGITEPPVMVTADAAFLLNTEEDIELEMDYFIVSVRGWNRLDVNFEKKIADISDYIKNKYGLEAVFVSMQSKYDLEISKRVCLKMKIPGIVINKKHSLGKMISIVQNARFVLGMRLHTLIYAAKAGVPVIGLSYDPKVKYMMEYMGQDFLTDVVNVEYENIIAYVDYIMEHYEDISIELKAVSEKLTQKAKSNTEIALELMGYS